MVHNMSAQATQADEGPNELEPPRQETDLYGEPVIEWGTDHEYWEGYVPDNGDVSDHDDRLMIAKYVEEDGEWVKTGLERAHITDIHSEAYNRRKGGE